jgi:tRNA A-37 threonylcarbamoyl transferase component Bud32
MDDIAVTRIYAGDGDGAEIVLEYNGKQIAVSLFPSHLTQDWHKGQHKPPIEDHLIDLLGRAVAEDCDGEYDDIIDEVLDVILDTGKPLFAQGTTLPTASPSQQLLHSLLYPETHNFRLETINSKPTIFPIKPNEFYAILEAQPNCDADSDFQIDDDLPQYSSKEIRVVESFVGSGVVSRVLVNGQEMLCKARRKGLLDPSLERELASLQKIKKACSSTSRSIRVPGLLGYVKHAEHGHVIGLLREWIPFCALGGRLRDMRVSTIPQERREKWAAQIRDTVDQLHDIEIIWGNGKPSNVIVDNSDDIWLVDFGGGWTQGWVDEELADTVEGDEQAVRCIVKFLGVETRGSMSMNLETS